MCCVIFFFFQAEDGIRDYKVTGVQTCALPIYRESRRLEREERHELLRRLRVAPRVRDSRLVPVVPVGDDGLARLHQLLHARDARLVRDSPEAVELALEVACLGDRLARGRRGAQELTPGIAHQHEEEPEVGACRLEEVQAVLLRPRVRPLVREHHATRVVARLAQRDEALPRHGLAADTVGLGVGINRGAVLAPPDAARQPTVENLARAGVLVLLLRRRGRRSARVRAVIPRIRHAHDVLRAHRVETLLGRRADLVVRRRHYRRHVAARADGVAVAAEGPDVHAQCPPTAAPWPLTTSAARAAGGVLRLRPIVTLPSIRTIEIPGRSPAASADSASVPTEPVGASQTTRSASRPSASVPTPSL